MSTRRLVQLERLEHGLDALAREMRACHTIEDPGWRSRINEYSRLAGDAMAQRKGTPTREGVLDLVFEVRPVFTGPIPDGMTALGPLQDEVMAAAERPTRTAPWRTRIDRGHGSLDRPSPVDMIVGRRDDPG